MHAASQEIFANGNTRVANTAAGSSSRLLLKQAGGKVTVAGKHGAAANVDPAYVAVDDNKTIHVVDKVLYGGEDATCAAPQHGCKAVQHAHYCQAAASFACLLLPAASCANPGSSLCLSREHYHFS